MWWWWCDDDDGDGDDGGGGGGGDDVMMMMMMTVMMTMTTTTTMMMMMRRRRMVVVMMIPTTTTMMMVCTYPFAADHLTTVSLSLSPLRSFSAAKQNCTIRTFALHSGCKCSILTRGRTILGRYPELLSWTVLRPRQIILRCERTAVNYSQLEFLITNGEWRQTAETYRALVINWQRTNCWSHVRFVSKQQITFRPYLWLLLSPLVRHTLHPGRNERKGKARMTACPLIYKYFRGVKCSAKNKRSHCRHITVGALLRPGRFRLQLLQSYFHSAKTKKQATRMYIDITRLSLLVTVIWSDHIHCSARLVVE